MTTSRAARANDAWESLLTAHAVLIRRFAATGIWSELTMREYDVLYTLSKCGAPVRLSELNEHVLLSQPALSRMVDRLVARGLVERAPDPRDGRGVLLSLTAAGAEQQRRTGRTHALDVADAMTGALDDAELRALTALCRRLAGSVDASPETVARTAGHW